MFRLLFSKSFWICCPLAGLFHALAPDARQLWTTYFAVDHFAIAAPPDTASPPRTAGIDLRQHPTLVLAVLHGVPDRPGEAHGAAAIVSDLVNAVRSHGKNWSETRDLLLTLEELSGQSAEPRPIPFALDHVYYPLVAGWHARISKEAEIRKLRLALEQPEQAATLLRLLAEYEKLPGATRDFMRAESAEVDGYILRYVDSINLDDVLRPFFQASISPDQLREMQTRIQKRVEALRDYLTKYAGAGSHVVWVRQESDRWETAGAILKTQADRPRDLTIQEQMRQFAELQRGEASSAALRDFAVLGARSVCDVYLARDVPLDNQLILEDFAGDDAATTLVEKSRIVVVWNDRRFQLWNECGHDEFTLPPARVRRVIVDGLGTRPPQWRPTPLSEAVHDYNEQRRDQTWTLAGVRKLKLACQPQAALLGVTWSRILEVEEIVQQFPALFPEK